MLENLYFLYTSTPRGKWNTRSIPSHEEVVYMGLVDPPFVIGVASILELTSK
jgi:hypothetical protein